MCGVFLACDSIWRRFYCGKLNRVRGRLRRHTWPPIFSVSNFRSCRRPRMVCVKAFPTQPHAHTIQLWLLNELKYFQVIRGSLAN